MIRYVGVFPSHPQNIATATPAMAGPRTSSIDLRILTGDDARRCCGREAAVLEVPVNEGELLYFTGRELLAFAAMMDATDA